MGPVELFPALNWAGQCASELGRVNLKLVWHSSHERGLQAQGVELEVSFGLGTCCDFKFYQLLQTTCIKTPNKLPVLKEEPCNRL